MIGSWCFDSKLNLRKLLKNSAVLLWEVKHLTDPQPKARASTHQKSTGHIPAPSNRSPLEAFADLKVAGGDLLEGAGI